MNTRLLAPSVMLLGLALGGCASGFLPEPPPLPRSFDFGPLPPGSGGGGAVVSGGVRAPSWLDGQEIRYRRLYRHPGALSAYAGSQWVAPPAELLEQRLAARLVAMAAPEAGPPPRLNVELQAFEQVFEASDRAYVVAAARVTLQRRGEAPVQQLFSVRLPSSPDIEGATRRLPEAAEALLDELLVWLAAGSGP
jgi:cholesterol transport system auxiliary component